MKNQYILKFQEMISFLRHELQVPEEIIQELETAEAERCHEGLITSDLCREARKFFKEYLKNTDRLTRQDSKLQTQGESLQKALDLCFSDEDSEVEGRLPPPVDSAAAQAAEGKPHFVANGKYHIRVSAGRYLILTAPKR